MTVAVNCGLADYRYVRAKYEFAAQRYTSAFFGFLEARATWPSNTWYRESTAISIAGLNDIPGSIAVEYVKDGLKGDPASPVLLWLGVLMGAKTGDLRFAGYCLYWMETRYPGWKETRNAREIFDFVSRQRASTAIPH